MKVGILAIQGDFELHKNKVEACGFEWMYVKKESDLDKVDGLIFPGGESTTITKIISRYGIDKALVRKINEGMPIFATCAGLIMMAKEFEGEEKEVSPLRVLNVKVKRNAYGRQRESFEAPLKLKLGNDEVEITGIFIRAPKITAVESGIEVLGHFEGSPVAVRQGNILAMTFHPELDEGVEIYHYFGRIIKERKQHV
ncbi:MAG: pyridoxal 5'-phosphate synthase glutaminase subunit PdxT [candidate division WOR-3 bacterium]